MEFPPGVTPPQKVRLYWRHDHYVLQWWDRADKKTWSDRVDGDLLTALIRVRLIDDRLQAHGRVSIGRRRLRFEELIEAFLTHCGRRCDAGELDVRTVARYRSALGFLKDFAAIQDVQAKYAHPIKTDREFVLGFQAFLQQQRVVRGKVSRQLKGLEFILATVRSAFSWVADPDGGNLLSDGFRNPFHGKNWTLRQRAADPTGTPPITIPMAAEWLTACDEYQRRLFTPLILFGLRAAEIAWVFAEDVTPDWFVVRCHPELDYLTKGQRDKKFPLVTEIRPFLNSSVRHGLWITRRLEPAAELAIGREALISEFQRRLAELPRIDATERRRLRIDLMRQHGALDYDQIEGEFRRLARQLNWPATATLKGFRHLFATALENSRCPASYRQYFMGQSQGRAAIVRYTHLDELGRHFGEFLETTYAPIIAALNSSKNGVSR